MNFYKRKLPHWQPEGGEYFITIRLNGSLPRSAIDRLKNFRKQLYDNYSENEEGLDVYIQRKTFRKYEELLDKGNTGPTWLGQNEIANIVEESIHYRNNKVYDLYAYCIMLNHVHMVFRHLKGERERKNPITNIMRNFKRYTARECNKRLHRSGAFWQSESYDHVIRDSDELEKTVKYTLNNPVKAGIIENWKDWPYAYCKPEFLESI